MRYLLAFLVGAMMALGVLACTDQTSGSEDPVGDRPPEMGLEDRVVELEYRIQTLEQELFEVRQIACAQFDMRDPFQSADSWHYGCH